MGKGLYGMRLCKIVEFLRFCIKSVLKPEKKISSESLGKFVNKTLGSYRLRLLEKLMSFRTILLLFNFVDVFSPSKT
ncbi:MULTISPECIES: hypothetical protein [Leptospira]|uniref:Uncharacterized protein n=2 Tax=Leptospira borgpetersenii TaxID=174 RepID=M3GUZ1_LEPBO|nr:hypothetical protein [Leptospira borgpetersenii]AXX15005.1 hypothetical protein C4Q31_05055 [Leptospira borgpetersenii serovar Ceylonica]EMF98653.1 hypothetical protein LEP1GSC123_2500 [Leptospira borgpetersenii str. 200701203]EMK10490.1 hypothetical protein LEP1GSC066_0355 [Leptospira sp. serovar Kenya str. Sh9]EKQ92345.1 hypothetical protein LEP1GSC101_2670 [Leptospira borgpetersenii str. UI 09149]EMN13902.1 hypothetical protein LEP1GSC055_0318 [Leptospira borgpetersenii str. Brem 307]